jgi:hypothetical protein
LRLLLGVNDGGLAYFIHWEPPSIYE